MNGDWQEVQRKLRNSLSRGRYDFWVSTIEFLKIEDACLVLGCQNRFHMEWLREKLNADLLRVAREHFPGVERVEYRIVQHKPELYDRGRNQDERQVSINDLIVRSRPAFNPRFTFEQFVVGKCNQFAYAAAMAMASGQQFLNQSVYLMADPGLGKSHLSQAVGNFLCARSPQVRVQYATTEQFANEMIFSLKQGSIEAFKNKYRSCCDVLLLEKIEFLSGKEKVQSELVYTLDELMNQGKKILCTGNTHPKNISRLNSELQSRLGGILVATIDRPDFQTRLEIIRRSVQRENIPMSHEVMEFLASRITGDVRRLESCLVGIVAKSSILNVPVSLELAEEVTQTMLDRLPKITIDHVQKLVCETFQVSREDLVSKSRKKELALARKVGMYLCRQYTSESLECIGGAFKRSHGSILYAVNGIAREMEDDNSKLKRQVEYLRRRLEISCLSG
ncbi:MAG: chromosomal replication initiator protein DnaA [Deltaproteobacteria bacterium]|nr:chromosomal replication initiator protein DnaA [Deltaproteobacteria bacterium]